MSHLVSATFALFCMVLASVSSQAISPDPNDCRKFQFQFQFLNYRRTFSCPSGTVFSLETKKCQMENGFFDDQKDCSRSRSALPFNVESACRECTLANIPNVRCLFPDPENCAQYYNCSKLDASDVDNLAAYRGECDYPDLFDGSFNVRSCRPWDQVNCVTNRGTDRMVPTEPCQYQKLQCGRSAHCKPCIYRFASCGNRKDGIQPWDGREWSPYYAECKGGRTLYSGECTPTRSGQPRIFSVVNNRCDDLEKIPRQFGGFLDE